MNTKVIFDVSAKAVVATGVLAFAGAIGVQNADMMTPKELKGGKEIEIYRENPPVFLPLPKF